MDTSLKLYLDTNVFDHILHKKGGITDDHLSSFRSALDAGRFLIPVSLLTVEETLLALENHLEIANQQLRLIGGLSDTHLIFKPPSQFLKDDIRGFAVSNNVSPFIEDNLIQEGLQEVLTKPQTAEELETVMEEFRLQKEDFRETMQEIKEKTAKQLREIQGEPPSFEDYFENTAPFFAEEYAARAKSLGQFKEDINKLIEIRSVRLSIGANLSLVYGQIVEGWKPNLGDGIDMRHLVPASACDILISNDKRLRKIVKRVPITNFEVCDFVSFVRQHC